jgi:Ser/Thr protein kinase RdoA (MazF antagonist)
MPVVELLTQLVGNAYGVAEVQLQPLHQFAADERGVYRVDRVGKPPWLLRAYRQAEQEDHWLAERAATLLWLARAGYPAPRVIRTYQGELVGRYAVRTYQGELVGRYAGWSVLLLTFIEGTVASGSAADFYAIGDALGHLHQVDVQGAAAATPPVPYARWQPPSTISTLLAGLVAIVDQIPSELQGLYAFCLATLQRVEQWPVLPMAILHTDGWAQNAIRTPDGATVLIDWDGAGLGPAVLDLGYALVVCHAFLPEWPHIVPSIERISALLDGYCAQRTLTQPERAVLSDAIACAEASAWRTGCRKPCWETGGTIARSAAFTPATQ